MTWLEATVDALAVYRITRLVVADKVTEPVREKVWESRDAESGLGYFVTCPWCVSFWVGAGVVAARQFAPSAWEPVARTMAASAVTGIISARL